MRQFNTKFITKQEFQEQIYQIGEEISRNYSRIKQNILSENLYPLDKNAYQFIARTLNKIDYKDRIKCVLSSLLLKEIYRSEVISAGAGQVAFFFALNLINELIKEPSWEKQQVITEAWEESINKIKEVIEKHSTILKEEDLKTIIENICGGEEDKDLLAEVCHKALNLAGLEGKIFVEDGKQENYIIELKDGYNFNLKPYKFFLDNKTGWDYRQCKVLIVDGLIENVSEIDQILNKSYETKQPMVIIALGFSEEVISTLYINYKNKKINVIPVRVPTDVTNLNIINDISVVCDTIPISSLKGDMLTFVKYENIPTINRIKITEKKTTIEFFKSRKNVSDQIRMLMSKRDDHHLQEEIQNFIDQRIKSLIPNTITIHLPEMNSIKNDTYRIKIDTVLRYCKSLLNYGTVSYKTLSEATILYNSKNDTEKYILDSFKKTLLDLMKNNPNSNFGSTLGLYLGIMLAGKVILMLYSTNGFVSFDL